MPLSCSATVLRMQGQVLVHLCRISLHHAYEHLECSKATSEEQNANGRDEKKCQTSQML